MENKKLKAVVITAVLCVALCLIGYGAFLFTSGREETPTWASHSIEEYSALAEHYNQAKDLYCQILDLDASIVNAEQGAILSSYDYTQKLDSVEKLLVELEAAKYPAKYSIIYEKLNFWIAHDAALYLQYSAMALGVSPSEAPIQHTMSMRSTMYSDWVEISELMAAISEFVDRPEDFVDLSWDPNVYFEQKTNGGNANAG